MSYISRSSFETVIEILLMQICALCQKSTQYSLQGKILEYLNVGQVYNLSRLTACTVHTVLATTMSSARHCSVVRSISSALLSTDCFWWNTFWYRSTLAHKQIEQCRSLKVALLKPPNFLLFPVGSFSLLAPRCVYHRSPIRTSPLTQASPVRAEKLGPETPTYPQYVQSMFNWFGHVMANMDKRYDHDISCVRLIITIT